MMLEKVWRRGRVAPELAIAGGGLGFDSPHTPQNRPASLLIFAETA
jgi:hypothetical protein